jgi:hypothetical protein
MPMDEEPKDDNGLLFPDEGNEHVDRSKRIKHINRASFSLVTVRTFPINFFTKDIFSFFQF